MGDQSVCLPCTPHSIRQTLVCVATPFWGQSAVGWNLKVNILAKGWSPLVWQDLEVSMWTKMLGTGWVWSCLVVGVIREKIMGCISCASGWNQDRAILILKPVFQPSESPTVMVLKVNVGVWMLGNREDIGGQFWAAVPRYWTDNTAPAWWDQSTCVYKLGTGLIDAWYVLCWDDICCVCFFVCLSVYMCIVCLCLWC